LARLRPGRLARGLPVNLLIELDRALTSEGVHLRDFAAEHGVQYRLVSSLVADLGKRGYATEIWQDPADVGAFRHWYPQKQEPVFTANAELERKRPKEWRRR
jgi:hypothetical protein